MPSLEVTILEIMEFPHDSLDNMLRNLIAKRTGVSSEEIIIMAVTEDSSSLHYKVSYRIEEGNRLAA